MASVLTLYKKVTKRNLKKILSEYSLYSFADADLNEFLIYILFNKKLLQNSQINVEEFFKQIYTELVDIKDAYLGEYQNAIDSMELEHDITLNEKENIEFYYFQIDSKLIEQVNKIIKDEKKGLFDIPLIRANKYNLQASNSQIGLLESWELYLNL